MIILVILRAHMIFVIQLYTSVIYQHRDLVEVELRGGDLHLILGGGR